jgi:hypothetical protein
MSLPVVIFNRLALLIPLYHGYMGSMGVGYHIQIGDLEFIEPLDAGATDKDKTMGINIIHFCGTFGGAAG